MQAKKNGKENSLPTKEGCRILVIKIEFHLRNGGFSYILDSPS